MLRESLKYFNPSVNVRTGENWKLGVGVGRGMESQKEADIVVEMKGLCLNIVELEVRLPCWDFHGTFGNADVEFRREVKNGDIHLGITVKAIKPRMLSSREILQRVSAENRNQSKNICQQ